MKDKIETIQKKIAHVETYYETSTIDHEISTLEAEIKEIISCCKHEFGEPKKICTKAQVVGDNVEKIDVYTEECKHCGITNQLER